MTLFFDRQGNHIPNVLAWAELYETDSIRRVAFDEVRKDDRTFHVSTIWEGIDHDLVPTHTPLIFETAVFEIVDNKPRHLRDMERTATEAEALAMHADTIRKITEGEDL